MQRLHMILLFFFACQRAVLSSDEPAETSFETPLTEVSPVAWTEQPFVVETPHPYSSGDYTQGVFRLPANARHVRVHFSYVDVASDTVRVVVYPGPRELEITGQRDAFWTEPLDGGDALVVSFVGHGSGQGFATDRLAVAGCLGDSECGQGVCVDDAACEAQPCLRVCTGQKRGQPCDSSAFCSAGLTCDYRDVLGSADDCALPNRQGVCATLSGLCFADYNPVCGCDGHTYPNECDRAYAGVAFAHSGVCAVSGAPAADAGDSCGGLTGVSCLPGLVCMTRRLGDENNSPQTTACGESGSCQDPVDPAQCAHAEHKPVCGCDGTTYDNFCVLLAANVSPAYWGDCR